MIKKHSSIALKHVGRIIFLNILTRKIQATFEKEFPLFSTGHIPILKPDTISLDYIKTVDLLLKKSQGQSSIAAYLKPEYRDTLHNTFIVDHALFEFTVKHPVLGVFTFGSEYKPRHLWSSKT
jgi:hypothetical protein